MAARPYIQYFTLCQATPIIGAPALLPAPNNQTKIQSVDMLTPNKATNFILYRTHTLSFDQTEIHCQKLKIKGQGMITTGAVSVIIDGSIAYSLFAPGIVSPKRGILMEVDKMDSGQYG